ncbi:MAG: right-handed parallel beta-helix repeat-containing protein [Bacteroidia bacterium]|nr:right-handed parallel beta-helix repeat-containing protein [Bacteroidia bacterium]
MKRIFLYVIISILTLYGHSLYGKNYFIASNGSNINSGTINSPFLTIAYAVSIASPGDTIFIRGGNYTLTARIDLSKSGNAASRMILWAFPGERPLLDFSGESFGIAGMNLASNYWYIKGISIKGAGDNGMLVSNNANNNIIEFCEFYENRDSGLQLSGGANSNKIINCDSYYNADPTDYGDADGFAVKMDVGTGNYFFGCRSWLNVDDGWDGYLRGANDVTTTIENCWTWNNGYFKDGTDAGANANGNGFKMGGSDDKTLMHNFILLNCLSFSNKAKGFDQNNNKGSITLYNCTGHNNTGNDFSVSSALNSGKTCTIKNCVVLGKFSLGSFVVQQTNSWLSPYTVNASDFLSIIPAEVIAPRQADGSLPVITYMHLAGGSDLIDAGTNVDLPYNGSKPDLGAWETGNYTINVTASGSGYIILKPAGGIYAPGTQVTITAISLSGNSFFNWSGNLSGTLPSVTVTINSNFSVTANFQVINDIAVIQSPKTGELTCNPTIIEGNTTIKLKLAKPERMNISVYNVSGQKVLDFGDKQYFSGENIQELTMNSLKPGAFILIASSKTTKMQCKLVKK